MVEKLYPCSELAIASAMFLVAEIFGFASNFLTNITGSIFTFIFQFCNRMVYGFLLEYKLHLSYI